MSGLSQSEIANSTPSTHQNLGAATKAVVKNAPGFILSFYVTNANAAVRYFQLHNKTTTPAAADVPQLYFLLPAGTSAIPTVTRIDVMFLGSREDFSLGIGWAISTTGTPFTDSATAADHTVMVRYV